MSIVQLGALAETQATYDSETGEELTPAVYYTNEATGEPWYHVDSTEPLDVPEGYQVTPEPNLHHEFAGIKTYHYRFASQAEFYELVPSTKPMDEEEPTDDEN